MNILRYVAFIAMVLVYSLGHAQSFQFAFVSDTHIGNPTAQEDLERTIADINANPNLENLCAGPKGRLALLPARAGRCFGNTKVQTAS